MIWYQWDLMNFIGKVSSLIILRQDKRVVEEQLPKKSGSKMSEHLIMGDRPIIEYRKHRQELIDGIANESILEYFFWYEISARIYGFTLAAAETENGLKKMFVLNR